MLFCLIVFFILLSSDGFSALQGSAHDMRYPYSEEPPCIYCHLPHAREGMPQQWERGNSGSSWMKGDKKTKKNLLKVARLCLGCHDGNIAPETGIQLPYKRLAITIRKTKEITDSGFKVRGDPKFRFEKRLIKVVDTDEVFEGHDHPIGVRLRDVALINPDIYKEPLEPSLRLFKGVIECSTCHSVHNTTPYQPFLSADMKGSFLCLSCHKQ